MSQSAHTYSEWRPAAALAFGVAFLALAWVTMSLRLWTRALIIKSLGWDDWAMLLTTVRDYSELAKANRAVLLIILSCCSRPSAAC